MRERLEAIISELKEAMIDVDRVETGAYGYKASAPRARKAALIAIKELKQLRIEIQNKKKSHE